MISQLVDLVTLIIVGYISTILKRRRWFQHIKAMEFGLRSQAERQAVNFVVQGNTAEALEINGACDVRSCFEAM